MAGEIKRINFPRTEPEDARVLIVDDHAPNAMLLKLILDHAGYRNVVTTNDPRDALRIVAEDDVDLVLLDLHMPHMSGLEVIDRIWRSSDRMPISRS